MCTETYRKVFLIRLSSTYGAYLCVYIHACARFCAHLLAGNRIFCVARCHLIVLGGQVGIRSCTLEGKCQQACPKIKVANSGFTLAALEPMRLRSPG